MLTLSYARVADATGTKGDSLKYLHIQVNFSPTAAERKLHSFRVTDARGIAVGELWGYNDKESLLIFEAEQPWTSLTGLYLDGQGHREPLFKAVPVADERAVVAPPPAATPVVPTPVVLPAETPAAQIAESPTLARLPAGPTSPTIVVGPTLHTLTLSGDWSGEDSGGHEVVFSFSKDGSVTVRVTDPKFIHNFPNGVKAKYEVRVGKPLCEIDMYDHDPPVLKGGRSQGILEVINGQAFKMEASASELGARPKQFSKEAILFRARSGAGDSTRGENHQAAISVNVEDWAKELDKAYAEGKILAFDAKYKGKLIRVFGKLDKTGRVADTMMPFGHGDYFAVFAVNGGPRCEFAKTDELVSLKKR